MVNTAAERVGGQGALVIQSQNPGHYALDAVARQELGAFYRHELKFRAELGYPPFRRLAVVSLTGGDTRRLGDEVAAALRASPRLVVYPPVAERRERARRIVVKGDAELPVVLAGALGHHDPGSCHQERAEDESHAEIRSLAGDHVPLAPLPWCVARP